MFVSNVLNLGLSSTDHYAWYSECNSVRYAYGINIAFNIVYAAKYLHKQCESKLVQYIIF